MCGCEIRFKGNCFVRKTLPGICVTCCGMAMLSNNDVRVMTSSLTPTSALLATQSSQKREDVCEIHSSVFCSRRRNHCSNDAVSISLGYPFQGAGDRLDSGDR